MAKTPYYLTTAIAYASRKPHFGNTYEAIMSDAVARYQRMCGKDVFFCTGTDEHGQKIEDLAKDAGITPKAYVDGVAGEIRKRYPQANIMFIGTAVIPPLIEEYAMRGVVLSSLSKYSNTLAIFGSAFMFGVFHGNFTQIPFAFMCGLVFAFITIASNSIWPAIIVHALNNSLSCIDSVLRLYFDSDVADVFYYAVSIGALVIGTIALIIYLKNYRNEDKELFKEDNTILTAKEKTTKFLLSPVMIVATVLYFLEAAVTAVTASML